MIVNYSQNSEYHSQRNNAVVPYESCNTTSMIMALKQAHVELPPTYDKQPEDELSRFLRSAEAHAWQKTHAPWSLAYPPQQVHVCLEWGVNRWIGGTVDRFSTLATKAQLLAHLDSGGGVVLSGLFRLKPGLELAHIVSVAGYEVDDEVASIIIDDPYGDYRTLYKDYRGNDIPVQIDEFNEIFRKATGYWAHFVGGRR